MNSIKLSQTEIGGEPDKLYFEVSATVEGFSDVGRSGAFLIKDLSAFFSAIGPVFKLSLAMFPGRTVESPSKMEMWRKLEVHCRKSWAVVVADDAELYAHKFLKGCRVVGAFRASNGLSFWLCHEVEQAAESNPADQIALPLHNSKCASAQRTSEGDKLNLVTDVGQQLKGGSDASQ